MGYRRAMQSRDLRMHRQRVGIEETATSHSGTGAYYPSSLGSCEIDFLFQLSRHAPFTEIWNSGVGHVANLLGLKQRPARFHEPRIPCCLLR
jgi:hypothetical protein